MGTCCPQLRRASTPGGGWSVRTATTHTEGDPAVVLLGRRDPSVCTETPLTDWPFGGRWSGDLCACADHCVKWERYRADSAVWLRTSADLDGLEPPSAPLCASLRFSSD